MIISTLVTPSSFFGVMSESTPILTTVGVNMCNLSNFWLLDIIVCCCAAMQSAGMCEEVLAAGACFLPLVPASFYLAVPRLMTACLRMQMGFVKGRFPVPPPPASRRAARYRQDLLCTPLCCLPRCGSVRGWNASAANAMFHRRGGRGPLLFGSRGCGGSVGASCPRCSWGWHGVAMGYPGSMVHMVAPLGQALLPSRCLALFRASLKV